MKLTLYILFASCLLSTACRKRTSPPCGTPNFSATISTRNFSMGFTTWPFGPDYNDRLSTYQFISSNADFYSEQFDEYIPWNALLNNQPLPVSLTNDVASRLSLRPAGHQLLLSVSLLNIDRTNLLADQDGSVPSQPL